MNNRVIIIPYEGRELTNNELSTIATYMAKFISSDASRMDIHQFTEKEVYSVMSALMIDKSKKENQTVKVKHVNSDDVTDAIHTVIKISVDKNNHLPPAAELGKIVIKLLADNTAIAQREALSWALSILARNENEIDFDTPQCKEYGLTKIHVLQLCKIHRFFSSMLL